ncbi:glycosyl transferase, group 2 family protein [Coleofasciculus chthonoplastes PCC 7420]|uniref:Glycosyl transferase, group 2 family protein n=1 Tax=Coleofasciculus chthonoplastes PCC 7420 TaxID=118168 RepID=B4VH95_9CYAN|nr:glycosyltransferase family A protein [Coleofasciculus chthonoplastes]EDX78575.1 glycosyl transferase, group 2 family protein [Coleofasciculus chthonoplastes PCC 7420]
MSLVSIITPLYNKTAYILDTIQSVLSQTYTTWEMLIVDNGSTDGSLEKAKQISDPRIHILQSPKQGSGAARNYGLLKAQGEWIQFLDADDLLEPDHLKQQLAVARQNHAIDIIACSWQEFNDENPTQRIIKQPSGIGQSIQVLRDSAIAFAPWAVHAALIRHSVLTEDYFWVEELDAFVSEDTAFWFCLLTKCLVAFSNNCGVIYRKQTSFCRNDYFDPPRWLEGMKAVTSYNVDFLKSHGDKPSARQCEMLMRCFLSTANIAHSQRDFTTERKAFALANQWFKECEKLGGVNTLPLRLRKIFGFCLIQYCLGIRYRLGNSAKALINKIIIYA